MTIVFFFVKNPHLDATLGHIKKYIYKLYVRNKSVLQKKPFLFKINRHKISQYLISKHPYYIIYTT